MPAYIEAKKQKSSNLYKCDFSVNCHFVCICNIREAKNVNNIAGQIRSYDIAPAIS